MDLAKVRKKLKEQQRGKGSGAPQDMGDPVTEEVTRGAEDPVGASGGSSPQEDTGNLGGKPEAGQGSETSPDDAGSEVGEFFVFAIADEYYAFRLSDLHEVLRQQVITHVPRMPDFIVGITSLRGKIVPIMDLRKRLAMHTAQGGTEKLQMLIIKGPKGPIGVLIDRVVGVRRIDETLVSAPPPHLDERQLPLIGAVVRDQDRFISILHVDHVFDFKPMALVRRNS